jgi:hypothetical protein
MERKRSREIALALAAAAVIVAVAVYRALSVSPAAAPAARSQAAGNVVSKQSPKTQPAELDLDALNAPRPVPVDTTRDPFRFKPKPPPPPPPPPVVTQGTQPAAQPPGPPPPPPIPLKFIGIVEGKKPGRVAVLTDGRGVYSAHEGEIVEGRYRILRIGVESVDLAYLDGRGRQTIRLTGQ